MSGATYFIQECPTCGRRLQVRVNYLGKSVACKHCQGQFIASDPDGQSMSYDEESGVLLLDKVDELLATADAWKQRPR